MLRVLLELEFASEPPKNVCLSSFFAYRPHLLVHLYITISPRVRVIFPIDCGFIRRRTAGRWRDASASRGPGVVDTPGICYGGGPAGCRIRPGNSPSGRTKNRGPSGRP